MLWTIVALKEIQHNCSHFIFWMGNQKKSNIKGYIVYVFYYYMGYPSSFGECEREYEGLIH